MTELGLDTAVVMAWFGPPFPFDPDDTGVDATPGPAWTCQSSDPPTCPCMADPLHPCREERIAAK